MGGNVKGRIVLSPLDRVDKIVLSSSYKMDKKKCPRKPFDLCKCLS